MTGRAGAGLALLLPAVLIALAEAERAWARGSEGRRAESPRAPQLSLGRLPVPLPYRAALWV